MSVGRQGFCAFVALGLAALLSAGAAAATAVPGVARVSLLHGAIDLKRADSGDTVAAAINAPLNPGDYLTTHDGARAEVEFGYDTALRLAPSTDIRLVALDADHARVQLAAGTVELRLARGTSAHAEIETPQATVRPTETGRYRISVAADGTTSVTVRSGRADIALDSGQRTLDAGGTLAFSGNPGDVAPTVTTASNTDDFDRWNDERDRTLAEADAARHDDAYVDDRIAGTEDLGAYGRWIDNPRYGEVWSPYEGAAWAPYRDGRFVWEPYYGWTWVAAEPWGWAPYHYGNWFYAANSGWCWYPGAYGFAQPYAYRPAVVGFFSFGFGSGVSLGFENVGWVPLAPYEAYEPWYGGYGNRTVVNNITNVTNITNVYNGNAVASAGGNVYTIYHNLRAPGGAHAVDRHAFAVGNFARRIAPDRATLVRAIPLRGIVPVVPTEASLHLAPGRTPVTHTDLGTRFAIFGASPVRTQPFAAARAAVSAASAAALTSMMPRANATVVRPAIVRAPLVTPVPPSAAVRPAVVRSEVATPVRPPTVIYLDGGPSTTPRNATPVTRAPSAHEIRIVTPASPWERFAARAPVTFSAPRSETFGGEARGELIRHQPSFERLPAYDGAGRERVAPTRVTFPHAAPPSAPGTTYHEAPHEAPRVVPHVGVEVERSMPGAHHN